MPGHYRMALGTPDADFATATPPAAEPQRLALWREFLLQTEVPGPLWAIGFVRNQRRMPLYNARAFRHWLLGRYDGDLARLNRELGTTFTRVTAIYPPHLDLTGGALPDTPLIDAYRAFGREAVPASRKFGWDAGGYYRAIFLPRLVGREIGAFNARYGTRFASYAEVPFSTHVPEVAPDLWMTFVSRMLRPHFVELSPEAATRMAAAGVEKEEYIRIMAKPEELRVVTIDRLFADWAQARYGMADTRIPWAALDREAFDAEAGFWRRTFLSLNYLTVLDEILLHGRAFWNTFILVTFSVAGTLLVNPLAAYALSRFKLRQTYSILLIFLATIAFPGEVTMIPVFLQLKELDLLNTFGALILPGLANGFSIFLLKGFFDSLPKELYEAAELDGASEWTMFWQIAMNLSKPILAVLALGAFVSAYGAFFFALILAPDPKIWTIMVQIFQLQQGVDSPVVYASLILTAIPTLLVFIFCQNIILRGIVVPTEK